ncbi:MAG TPA: HU family DNA-binding protein [Gammaproteobacteria bacterium]|nr:HU family DNA-binding protein [Gammaproteobacteria bacterium]
MATKKVKKKNGRTTTSVKKATTGAKATGTMKKLPSITQPYTKGTILKTIAEVSSVSRKDAAVVIETLAKLIEGHVKPKGPGVFTMPGLLKIMVVKKPARPAREGINPFTGEKTMFKARPARKVVKIRALKKLKEMVEQA